MSSAATTEAPEIQLEGARVRELRATSLAGRRARPTCARWKEVRGFDDLDIPGGVRGSWTQTSRSQDRHQSHVTQVLRCVSFERLDVPQNEEEDALSQANLQDLNARNHEIN